MPRPLATSTATMMCSFGMAPSALNVLPTTGVLVEGKPVATLSDSAPIVNIPPFGMCSSLANPTVAAATSAALGVLTPMPCVPATTPWANTTTTATAGSKPMVALGSTCQCAYGGVIQILNPGAVQTLGP